MIAVTARRILTLLALVAPASGRDAAQAPARGPGRETGRAAASARPDGVVFRHYL